MGGDLPICLKMLHFISHPDYDIPLPPGHRFPAGKFTGLMRALLASGLLRTARVSQPRAVSADALACVHAPHYIAAIADGSLSEAAQRTLGLPWSERLARRSRLAVMGSYKAALKALEHGVACHGAGGTHHAHYDHGAGFCVFNDMAFAARQLVMDGKVERVLILDADVHQGDGTAAILCRDDQIFTASLHCPDNYPHRQLPPWGQVSSDDNVLIPKGTGDDAYLAIMAETLERLDAIHRPQLVIYDAGVDVHQDDALGHLNLTDDGIKRREDMVLSYWFRRGVPVVTVLGGGYLPDVDHLIRLHMMAVESAASVLARPA